MISIDQNIIINYHSVRDPEPNSGIFSCDSDEFERHIVFLTKHFRITSVQETYEKRDGDERLCAITFDDGQKDQYKNAVPILKKYGVTATFFPITSTFEGKLPPAHALQSIRAHAPVLDLVVLFERFFPGRRVPREKRIYDRWLNDDILTANMKGTIGMLPVEEQDAFFAYLFQLFGIDEKTRAEELFMNRGDIRDLHAQGFSIGNHTHRHYLLDSVSGDALRADLEASQRILGELCGERPIVFSYPHGRYTDTAIDVLQEAGFRYAVTIERRAVAPEDHPYRVPRFDAKDLIN